jgi:hypothetical protein
MNAREKAYWLSRANPYKREYLRDAFKLGARQFWSGRTVEINYLNAQERAAFWKGYAAAEEETS